MQLRTMGNILVIKNQEKITLLENGRLKPWSDFFLGMYWATQATITRYYKLGGLNNRHLFFPILEVKHSKVKVSADSVPGMSWLPGLPMAAFLLHSHMVEKKL